MSTTGRRALLAIALPLAFGGCESQELTTPVTLDVIDREAIGVAVVAVFVLWLACALRFALKGMGLPTCGRVVAAAVFLSTSVIAVGFVGWVGATEWRTTQIMGTHECGSVPDEQIPTQIVQLSCSDSDLITGQGNTVFAGILAAPFALLGWRWACSVARRPRPMGAAIGASILLGLFTFWTASAISDGADTSDMFSLLGIVALYATAAAGAWLAIQERPPASPVPQ